jgi:tripartite-type tricarboxylate transporter receptor subunit TctC
VVGGHVPFTYRTLGSLAPYLPGGKLVALAVADAQRSPLAPDVPTLAELGYKDVELTAWYGLFGPRNMPADVVRLLNTHLNEVLKMPDVVARMATLGTVPVGGPPQRLGKTNASDFERFGRLVKELGIQSD